MVQKDQEFSRIFDRKKEKKKANLRFSYCINMKFDLL